MGGVGGRTRTRKPKGTRKPTRTTNPKGTRKPTRTADAKGNFRQKIDARSSSAGVREIFGKIPNDRRQVKKADSSAALASQRRTETTETHMTNQQTRKLSVNALRNRKKSFLRRDVSLS